MLLKVHVSATKSTTCDSAIGQINKAFNRQATCSSGYVAFGGKIVLLPLDSALLVYGLSIMMEKNPKSYDTLCYVMLHFGALLQVIVEIQTCKYSGFKDGKPA